MYQTVSSTSSSLPPENEGTAKPHVCCPAMAHFCSFLASGLLRLWDCHKKKSCNTVVPSLEDREVCVQPGSVVRSEMFQSVPIVRSAVDTSEAANVPSKERGVCVHINPAAEVVMETPKQPSLESMFLKESTTIDLNKKPDFAAYLSPNEGGACAMRPHLPKTRGIDVVTGTERAFFLLALRGPESEGLVVRDFHPYVKAYVDFNTLLLRIARDREHYVQLSTLPPNMEVGSLKYDWKIDEIRALVERASIPPEMKQYYLDHLKDFAKIYFGVAEDPDSNWRNKSVFDGVKYYENDALFYRLQQYARSGNIIATVGNMNDLRFLDQRNIATLDISNIPDYFVLNIQTQSQPIVITTTPSRRTNYASSKYHRLSDQQIYELDGLLEIFLKILGWKTYESGNFGMALNNALLSGNPEYPKEVNSCFYSESLLNAMKRHRDLYWRQINNTWVDFSPQGTGKRWADDLTESDVRGLTLPECVTIVPFLPTLLQSERISDDVRIALKAIPDRITKERG